jgi:hypothetical protein
LIKPVLGVSHVNKNVSPRAKSGKALEFLIIGGALAAFFMAGNWYALHSQSGPPHVMYQTVFRDAEPFVPKDVVLAGNPPVHLRPPLVPRESEPRAIAARTAAIRRDAAAIRAECERAAGGDWDRWLRDTQPCRKELGEKLAALKVFPPPQVGPACEPLAGKEGFPLFEIDARVRVSYLQQADVFDQFRKSRVAMAADRWLRRQGIDLIFVPVPKMTEIYIDRFLSKSPPDRIIAPHVRRTLLELLEQDVEVIDGFSLFNEMRDFDSEYLYNTADTHWAPRGMRIMAKAIADRVDRYRFGAQARFRLPMTHSTIGPNVFKDYVGRFGGFGYSLISPEQAGRAKEAQTTSTIKVETFDNQPLPDEPTSPVMLIGNSFVLGFREQLIRELNMLIMTRWNADNTTQHFLDFLREPTLLDHCRVIVWITTEQHMSKMGDMPGVILKVLDEPNQR